MKRKLNWEWPLSVACIAVLATTIGCLNPQERSPRDTSVAKENNEPSPPKLDYRIIDEEQMGDIKVSLAIRLPDQVDEATLRRIANELRNDGRTKFHRLFITYYLPGMTVGHGAWATTHFNPSLEVRILGLTRAQEANQLKEIKSSEGRCLGVWVDNVLGATYTIMQKENALSLKRKYKDGGVLSDKLIPKNIKGEKRLMLENNEDGEYFVLNKNGTLNVCDKYGLIVVLPRLK